MASIWFYYRDGANNFNADFPDNNVFNSFKHKAKVLKYTVANGNNSKK